MRRTAVTRGPHLLLDIDHTLLWPVHYSRLCAAHQCDVAPGQWACVGSGAGVTPLPLTEVGARLRDCDASPCQQQERFYGARVVFADAERESEVMRDMFFVLRPHAVRLLAWAPHTGGCVPRASLFTRQTHAYCRTVRDGLLLPALHATLAHSPHCPTGPASGTEALRLRLFHGGHCCGKEGSREGTADSSPAGGGGGLDIAGWRKSVRVAGSPLTSLLLDDNAENFIPAEERSGHCLRVPSFKLSLNHLFQFTRGGCDEAFMLGSFPPLRAAHGNNTEGDAHDVLAALERENTPRDDSALGAATAGDAAPATLFSVVSAFEACCQKLAQQLNGEEGAYCGSLEAHNLFELSPQYSNVWMRFQEHFAP